jgi:hypothetical protein
MAEDLHTQEPDPEAVVNTPDMVANTPDIKEPPLERSPIKEPDAVQDELIDDDRFQRSDN